MFCIIWPLFLQKTKPLYQTPKYLLESGIWIQVAKNLWFSFCVSVVLAIFKVDIYIYFSGTSSLFFHPLTSFCNYLGCAVMDFFIMWLCFYTSCILALYAGARHDRRSENSLSHRQIQQLRIEYLQTIRNQQFGIRTYSIHACCGTQRQ